MSHFRWLSNDSAFDERLFRRVFERVKRPLPPDPEIVTAYTDGQVTLRSNRAKEGYHEAADLSGFQGVQVGDFVVHGLDILRGSVGVADSAGALSSVCTVCVPRGESDPRFFAYAMRAQAWAGVPRVLAKGIREGGADFRRWDTLADLPLPVPPLAEQRAIADYLQTVTARIDSLISKKRRMIELIDSRSVAEVVKMTTGDGQDWNECRLRRAVHSVVGGSWGNEPGEGEVEAICIRGADFDMASLGVEKSKAPIRSFSRKEFLHREMRVGDLLIEKSGGGDLQPVGRVVRWCGSELAVPTNFAARLRPAETMDSDYLAFVFRAVYETGRTRAWIKQTTGIQNLDLFGFLSEEWPIPPLATQSAIARQLGSATIRHQQLRSQLRAQIQLLIERRQALITTAVRGELDIRGVAA